MSSYTTYQWYEHGVAIPGATDSSYTATQNDTYSVVVTNMNGCSVGIEIHLVTHNEGVGQITGGNDIVLYPNPNNGQFTIKGTLGNATTVKAEVINVLGQVIWADNIPNANGGLNTPISLPANIVTGVYYLHIKTDDVNMVRKFTVNK